jgi:hypothetical protein
VDWWVSAQGELLTRAGCEATPEGCDQRRKLSLSLQQFVDEGCALLRSSKVQILRDNDREFQFHSGASPNLKESDEFSSRAAATTLRDVEPKRG